MGLKWTGQPLNVVVEKTANGAYGKTLRYVTDIVNYVLSEGAEHMVNTIKTTPSSIVKGKDNRIDTGLMSESIDVVDLHKTGRDRYAGSAGWVALVEDYFLVQDQGGMSSGLLRGDRQITPMHALSKAYYFMKQELQNELGRF